MLKNDKNVGSDEGNVLKNDKNVGSGEGNVLKNDKNVGSDGASNWQAKKR